MQQGGSARGTSVRVLVLAPPMDQIGGVQSFTSALVRGLRQVMGEPAVCLLAVRPGAQTHVRRAALSGSGEQGKLGAASKTCFLLRVLWREARWRATLCICTHIGLAPIGRLMRALFRCPYWVVAHGIEVWGDLPGGKRTALRAADRILAVSAFTRQRLIEQHQISPGRV